MKNLNKLIAASLMLVAFTTNSNAQSTAYSSATATLLTPISIAKNTDLNFGTLAASATAGTVVIDYVNGRTKTGGVKLLAGSAAEKTAVFTVTGEGTNTFSISIPSSITLTNGASQTMVVNSITCQEGTSNQLISGTKVLKVKGTLVVSANQNAGVYTNTATDNTGLYVTVNYN